MRIEDLFKLGMDRDIPALLDIEVGVELNLGSGNKVIKGAMGLDLPKWDGNKDPLPFPDDSVAGVHAYHFLEHLDDPIKMLREIERVLRVGGVANIIVPYYTSQMQAHDLNHKHVFCEETWKILFSNPYYDTSGGEAHEWKLYINTNIIIGVVERNLALMTQLVKG